MGKRRKIPGRVLAERWGISVQAVSKLLLRHGAPDFETIEEADTWRELVRQRGVGHDGKIAGTVTTSNDWKQEIDAETLLREAEDDFHGSVVGQAREIVIRAFAAVKDAQVRGEVARSNAQLKIWGEAAKQSGLIEERFLELQVRARHLISLDEVMVLWGNEMGAIRRALTGLGDRLAARVNPGDPALGKSVIDGAVDRIFDQLAEAHQQLEVELNAGTAEEDAS